MPVVAQAPVKAANANPLVHPLVSLSEGPLILDATWELYEELRELFNEHGRKHTKLTFCDGILEITPANSQDHEVTHCNIGRVIEFYLCHIDREFTALGKWTIKVPKIRGTEPDECYVFGERGSKSRPDLAVEVNFSSGSINKLQVYLPYEVPEVWIWQDRKLQAFEFSADSYREVESSKLLPGLPLGWVEEFAIFPTTSGAIRELQRRLEGRSSKAA